MMTIPLVDLQKQYLSLKKELLASVHGVLMSGKFILSEQVKTLEEEAAQFTKMPYAVGVNSGTDALLFALKVLGIGKGDEVLTTPFTFIATVEAIVHAGAKPVFVDIDEKTYNMDVSQINAKISKRTKALLPVHLYGQTVLMGELCRLARKHRFFIIEDMCQAFGAEYDGKKAGAFGDASCTSFFPSKNLGGYGDGGMIFLKSKKHYDVVRKMRAHGAADKGHFDFLGYNSRLDEVQAAVLRVKLKHLDAWNKKRWENAQVYKKYLRPLVPDIILPHEDKKTFHIYNLFVIRTKPRDALLRRLIENGIMAQIHYPVPVHLQEAFSDLKHKTGDFPVAEKCSKEILSLPVYPELTEKQIQHISHVIAKFFNKT